MACPASEIRKVGFAEQPNPKRLKPENSIAHRMRSAGSGFQDFRTPAGARNSSGNRPDRFRAAIRVSCHSLRQRQCVFGRSCGKRGAAAFGSSDCVSGRSSRGCRSLGRKGNRLCNKILRASPVASTYLRGKVRHRGNSLEAGRLLPEHLRLQPSPTPRRAGPLLRRRRGPRRACRIRD